MRSPAIPERQNWRAMIRRCTDERHPHYARYGGRGVVVCQAWLDSFNTFLRDVGSRPSARHTLDRINNDGNYEPGNVRWATWEEQLRNRGDYNNVLTAFGESKTISEWCERFGLWPSTVRKRIARGWSPEEALTKPIDPRKSHKRSAA